MGLCDTGQALVAAQGTREWLQTKHLELHWRQDTFGELGVQTEQRSELGLVPSVSGFKRLLLRAG